MIVWNPVLGAGGNVGKDDLLSPTSSTNKIITQDDLGDLGGGDMLKSQYDPSNKNIDAFDMENMDEGVNKKILSVNERIEIAKVANKVDKVAGKELSDENFTTLLKTAVELKKLEDLTLDPVLNKVTLHYTDGTTSVKDFNDVVYDIYVNGASLDASSNVLTLTTEGGADVTVDLSDFVNSSELTSALLLKQDALVSGTNIKEINNQSVLGSGNLEIVVGSGGVAGNVFLTNTVSSTDAIYNQLSYTADAILTQETAIANNNTVLISDYIFDGEVLANVFNGGVWDFTLYGSVSNTSQVSNFVCEIFARDNLDVERILFSQESQQIVSTSVEPYSFLSPQESIAISPTDKIGIKIYAKTTRTNNTTFTLSIGDGEASFFTTTLAPRLESLRDRQIKYIDGLEEALEGKVSNNGTELIPNGNFDTNTDGVNGSPTAIFWDSGRLRLDGASAGSNSWVWINFPTVIGNKYIISFNYEKGTSISNLFSVGNGNTSYDDTYVSTEELIEGNNQAIFTAIGTSASLYLFASISGNSFFDNISSKKIESIDSLDVKNNLSVGDIENVENQVVLNTRPELVKNSTFDTNTDWDTTNPNISISGGELVISPASNGWIYSANEVPIKVKPNTRYSIKVIAECDVGNIYYGKLRINGEFVPNATNDIITLDSVITSPTANTPKITEVIFNSGLHNEIFIILGAYFANGIVKYDLTSLKQLDEVESLRVNNKLLVNTDGLHNATEDHKLQVEGIVLHGLVWKDLEAPFIPASGNAIDEPSWEDCGNGVVLPRWTTDEHLPVSYHVNHDYAEGTVAYPHIHFFSDVAESAGTIVTWRFGYIRGRANLRGDSLTAPLTNIDITYTYTGTEVAGEPIIAEASIAQAFGLLEPDTKINADVKLISTTATGKIFADQADLHFQADREGTIGKKPDFNKPD